MNAVATRLIRLCLLAALLCAGFAANAFNAPKFQGDVLDETGTLTSEQVAALKQRILELRTQDDVWAAIYFSKGLQGETIDETAVAVFEKWKLGKKGKDNGLLIMVAPTERKIRIEVGYGLEGEITDAMSRRIIDNIYKPAFRDNRYADGLMEGFDFISLVMRKEAPPEAAPAEVPATQEVDVDWGDFGLRFFGTWLINMLIPIGYWLYQRNNKKKKSDSTMRVKSAFGVFAFLGFIFAIFTAVFSIGFVGEEADVVWGIYGMNVLFDLVFFAAIALGKPGSGGSGSSWSSGSSSSWSSSSSSSSSSSGGGSSGGGGSSSSY